MRGLLISVLIVWRHQHLLISSTTTAQQQSLRRAVNNSTVTDTYNESVCPCILYYVKTMTLQRIWMCAENVVVFELCDYMRLSFLRLSNCLWICCFCSLYSYLIIVLSWKCSSMWRLYSCHLVFNAVHLMHLYINRQWFLRILTFSLSFKIHK